MNSIKKEIEMEITKCVRCGFCRGNCPTLKVIGWDSFGPRGRVIIIKEWLEGNLNSEEILSIIFSCAMCGYCDEVCPSSVKVSKIIRRVRYLICSKRN